MTETSDRPGPRIELRPLEERETPAALRLALKVFTEYGRPTIRPRGPRNSAKP